MVYRNTAIAVAAILGFALVQLSTLLRPTASGPPWPVIVVAGLFLGAVITWTGLSYRLPVWLVALLNIGAATVVSFRIATPDTMSFLLPTAASAEEMSTQFSQAMTIIRNGIEPVLPVSGLVVLITVVLWAVGALTTYGLNRGHPALAVLPGLVLALQFATMDRSPTSYLQILVFVALLAGAILAVTLDERRATAGRMAHPSGRVATARGVAPAAMGALTVTLFGSLLAVAGLQSAIPVDGLVSWRATTGLSGSLFGSVSYNPFIGIQSSLVTSSDTPLFVARIDGDVPADRVYFRLVTMEQYRGGQFSAGGRDVEDLDDGDWEDPGQAFAGPTATVRTDVLIDRLRMEWLPAAYAPVEISGDDAFTRSVQVRASDGALLFDGGVTYPQLLYSVTSTVPQPDLTALTAGTTGDLSALFAAAAAAGETGIPEPVESPVRDRPPDAEAYLELPENLEPGIAALAAAQTANLDTPFERGLALESWFRSDAFRYTIDIPPGHGAADIAEWLLPEYADEDFYRAGYCENFATAMAVMARTLDIPSRVVLGFTPGEAVGADNIVVVRDRNAHAWVELWMPSQGWVKFDPTPRSDAINPATTGDVAVELGFDPVTYFDRIPGPAPGGQPIRPPDQIDPRFGEDEFVVDPSAFDRPAGGVSGVPGWVVPVLTLVVVGGVTLCGVPLLKWLRRRSRMSRLDGGDVTAAWEEIVARLTDLGDPPDDTLTPTELAEAVDPAMAPLAAVYGRAVYGAPGSVATTHLEAAKRSMAQTKARLDGRHSSLQRLLAWYRPGSLLPGRWRKRRTR